MHCLIWEDQVGLAVVRVALWVRSPMQALCATGISGGGTGWCVGVELFIRSPCRRSARPGD